MMYLKCVSQGIGSEICDVLHRTGLVCIDRDVALILPAEATE